jgi:hypothetical protein
VTFSLFRSLKTHFRAGRHENKEKRLFYFGLKILLPIQIQFLEIENQKILIKLSPPTCTLAQRKGHLQLIQIKITSIHLVSLDMPVIYILYIIFNFC